MSKEPNQVKWRGIKLATGEDYLPTYPYVLSGTQIAKDETATNETKIIHTVTAAKILYLSAAALCGKGAGNGNLSLEVRDAGDVLKYHLFCTNFKAGEACGMTLPLRPAIKIPAGYDIIVISAAAGVEAHGFIHGFELEV